MFSYPRFAVTVNFNVECRLVNVVVRVMGDVFPEVKQHEGHIRDIIAAEEASFGKTLLKVSMSVVYSAVFNFCIDLSSLSLIFFLF